MTTILTPCSFLSQRVRGRKRQAQIPLLKQDMMAPGMRSKVMVPPGSDAMSKETASPFFALPPEVRLGIYADVLSRVDIDLRRLDAGSRSFEPPLLRLNELIRVEAMQAYHDRLEALVEEAEAERYAATVRLLAVLNKKLEFIVPWELQYALSEDDAAIKRVEKLADVVDLEREKMEADGFPVARWRLRRRKNVPS